MDEEQIKALVRQFDTTRSSGIEAAWSKLRPLGGAMVPFLADACPTTQNWLLEEPRRPWRKVWRRGG